MTMRGKKIYVGLSGGVDSAVSAAVLQKEGADVVGVFIKGWYPPGMPCTWAADRRDAMRVAARLHIPFLTLDAGEAYKKGVMDYLISEYRAGRTPNPDIMCNREVKFGAFHAFAVEHGADYIATGHYAQVLHEDGTQLLRGIDADKDQSYFLWAVPKAALAMTLMPVGGMRKEETRRLAKKFDLPVAEKRDSQGICFLGSVSVDEYLRAELGTAEGATHDEAGNLVGTHDGVTLYTIGERIALRDAAPGPWYVVRKDLKNNTLVVSHEHLKATKMPYIRLGSENWFKEPREDEAYRAQYRYHGPLIAGTYTNHTFVPTEPLPEAIADGQSLVLYRDEECIGGGIIG